MPKEHARWSRLAAVSSAVAAVAVGYLLAGLVREAGTTTSIVAHALAVTSCAAAVAAWQTWERRSVVDKLARSALALRNVGEAVIVVDEGDVVLEWNRAAERMYGWTAEEAVGRTGRSLVDWPPVTLAPPGLAGAPRGDPELRHEARHRHKDGRELRVSVTWSTMVGPEGRVAVVAARDVTEQHRTARALEASEERLALALAGSGSEALDWDLDRGIFLGRRWSSQLGVPGLVEGDLPEIVSRLVHPEDRLDVLERLGTQLAKGDAVQSEHRVRLQDGGVRWVSVRGQVVERGPRGAPRRIAGTVRDVTDEHDLRDRLARTDRLASLGTLAAGIAHEVNNPVAYVAANLTFLREQLAIDGAHRGDVGELRDAVGEALSGVARVREIVAGLKQFAQPGERRAPGPVDVRAELEAAVGMTRHEIAHRARLAVDVPPSLPFVVAGRAELGQVFVNLLVNAAHAIPEGRAAENEVEIAARADAERVVVEVRDTGAGIALEILPRIFDPFFTTKPVGSGTGLGLSICHGIVNAAGGAIEVESAPGAGSTFRVILPVAPPASREDGPEPAAPAPRSRARVLVVDDEPLVARALARVLQRHEVVVTSSPVEALAWIVDGERWDVVLCDLMMPEMNGMELEARVAQAAPDMVGRLVFMTGGAFTPGARAFLDSGRPHLEKPIDPAVLRDVVARRLATS